MSKHEPSEKDYLATLQRALSIIRSSKTTRGGVTTIHADGSMTEERWTTTDLEGADDAAE